MLITDRRDQLSFSRRVQRQFGEAPSTYRERLRGRARTARSARSARSVRER